jgi:hypothetical protein
MTPRYSEAELEPVPEGMRQRVLHLQEENAELAAGLSRAIDIAASWHTQGSGGMR